MHELFAKFVITSQAMPSLARNAQGKIVYLDGFFFLGCLRINKIRDNVRYDAAIAAVLSGICKHFKMTLLLPHCRAHIRIHVLPPPTLNTRRVRESLMLFY
jgi:hypothetical protein